MNHTITTTLWDNLFNYINDESKKKNITKKSIIEKWLEYYRKYEMEKSYKAMWRDKEYLSEMQENSKYLGNI